MKITTLIENNLAENKNLIKEHGLSVFIESDYGNILFDTGQSGDFIKNANSMNINLDLTKYLILSHAHYDHCGGVKKFLEQSNCKPELYISKYFFQNSDKYHIKYKNDLSKDKIIKYIGVDFNKQDLSSKNIPINYINHDYINLTPEISIHTNFEKTCDFEAINPNLKYKVGNNLFTDNFKDEIALAIQTRKGLVILVGCSHPGVINIINSIQKRMNQYIYGVIGGTHLVEADNVRIEKTIDYFSNIKIKLIGVSHCTGETATKKFKDNCNNFFLNSTGTVIEI